MRARLFGRFARSLCSQQNTLFMSMELCDAGSLSELVRTSQTPLRESQTVAVLWQSLKALQFLGEKAGFVHMDVRALHLLLCANGEVKLCDFKNAFALNELADFTPAAGVLGERRFWSELVVVASFARIVVVVVVIDRLYLFRSTGRRLASLLAPCCATAALRCR